MSFLRNLFGKSNQPGKDQTTPAPAPPTNPQRSAQAATQSKFWKCSQCGSTLEKQSGAAMAVFEAGGSVAGTVTCGVCGAKHSLNDVYAGKFDVTLGTQYDLVLLICDTEPADRDAYLATILHILNLPLSANAQGVLKQHPDARDRDKIFPYAMTCALDHYRRMSMDLDDKSVKLMAFEYPQGQLKIGGTAYWMRGKG